MHRIVMLTLLLASGCGTGPPTLSSEAQRQIFSRKIHVLDWTEYGGTGDKQQAIYQLDGHLLGQGDAGIDALRRLIARMPRDSVIQLARYYSDPGGTVGLSYPFDVEDLQDFAKDHGVVVALQKAG